MLVFPHAKINLGLNVLSKRPDGFHNIETLFFPIGLCDLLEMVVAADGQFEFETSGLPVPGGQSSNLCVRVCRLLGPRIQSSLSSGRQTEFFPPSSQTMALPAETTLPPVKIHLHKVIPMGAGLGGGSADGAFTLKLLNELFNLGLSVAQLEDYARQLGSDCAFFIKGKPVFAYERGDRFVPPGIGLPPFSLLLVVPDIHCGTAAAYAAIKPAVPDLHISDVIGKPMEAWKKELKNDFEQPVFRLHPELQTIKNTLYDAGAMYASLSGSGSAVYGIFHRTPPLDDRFPGCFVWHSDDRP